MTALTANRKYVYPIATDRPCDAPLAISQMINSQFEPDLLYLDSEYRRFERPPMVIVEAIKTQSVVSLGYVLWDTEVDDTWGMADLALSNQIITLPAKVPGLYMVGGLLVGGAIGAGNLSMTFNVGNTIYMPANDTGAALDNWAAYQVTNADVKVNMQINAGGTTTVTYARMWAYWARDL